MSTMGNDLYWKQTPKEPEEEYNGLHRSTWYFLAELWNEEDKNNLAEAVLTKENIAELKTILTTAKASNISFYYDDEHCYLNVYLCIQLIIIL